MKSLDDIGSSVEHRYIVCLRVAPECPLFKSLFRTLLKIYDVFLTKIVNDKQALFLLKIFIYFSQGPKYHCVKRVRIGSFSGPYFSALGLNTDIYGVNLLSQSECGKMRIRKISNADTFNIVYASAICW